MDEDAYNPALRLLCMNRSRDLHGWWNMPDLRSPYWRFYWHEARGAQLTFAGRRIALNPERVFLIPPDTPCRADCPGHTRQFFLHFLASGMYAEVPPGVYSCPLADELNEAVLRQAADSADQQREPGTYDYAPEATRPLPPRRRTLLGLRLILLALERALPEELLRRRQHDPRLRQVFERLEPAERPRSNAELAKLVPLSESAFTRLFRAETGMSPQAYQRIRRIEEACRLLHHTNWPIVRIAQRLHFRDRYHFSRVFKRERGMGPAEFRRLFPFSPPAPADFPAED